MPKSRKVLNPALNKQNCLHVNIYTTLNMAQNERGRDSMYVNVFSNDDKLRRENSYRFLLPKVSKPL